MNNLLMLIALFAGVLALAYAALNFFLVRKLKEGNERMQEIAAAIREGANAFFGTNTKSSPSSAAPSP